MDELRSGRPAELGARGRTPGSAGGPSRRTVVVSGLLAVLAGAGGGVAAAFARPRHAVPRAPTVPAAVTDALAAERRLLGLAGSLAADAPALAAQLRTDHAAHARALEAVVRRAGATVPPTPTASPTAPAPMSRARLRVEEAAAASRAAAAAASLSGPVAALLASIAACEAGHAELLT